MYIRGGVYVRTDIFKMPQETTRISGAICITSNCSGTAFYDSKGTCVGVCKVQNEPVVVSGPVTLAKTFADTPTLRIYPSAASTATDATDQVSSSTGNAMLAKLSGPIVAHLECAVLNLKLPLAHATLFWYYKLLAWRTLEDGGTEQDAKDTALTAMFKSKEAIAIFSFLVQLQKYYTPNTKLSLEQMGPMCMAIGSLGEFDGSEAVQRKALERIVDAIIKS